MRLHDLRWLRTVMLPLGGLVALGVTLSSCGNASDPDPVTLDKLKAPLDLKIRDDGDGAITLIWSGANNEEKFDGYNVYGMKGTATSDSLGVTEGKPLELLDKDGEAIAGAKTVLAKFNYGPTTGLESAPTPKEDADKDISALPIHTLDASNAPLLPTCKHDGSATADTRGKCVNTTTANMGNDVSDSSTIGLNGDIEYALTGLKPGSNYCFLVMSSMDKGKKISAQSSKVVCVKPRFKKTISLNAVSQKSEQQLFNLKTYVAACTTSCGDPATFITTDVPTGVSHLPTDAGPLYIENLGTSVAFVSGKWSAIQDLGYRAKGFASNDLPAPKLVISDYFNRSGYFLAGQSAVIQAKHMYVIAVGDPAATSAPTSFQYQWVYVEEAPVPAAGAKFSAEFRLTSNLDQRN